MSTAPADCAVLLFVRLPEPGMVKTRLAATIGDELAAELYRAMTEDLTARLRGGAAAWGYKLHLYATPPESLADILLWLNDGRTPVVDAIAQPDGTLGDRLEHAFAFGFGQLRASAVVVIGSDAPALAPSHLAQARAGLATHDAVIGLASDGGFYLLALRRPAPGTLRDLPYSSEKTAAAVVASLLAAGLTVDSSTLPMLHDVDVEEDLVHLPRGSSAALLWQAQGQADA